MARDDDCPQALGLRPPTDHEKYDCRSARDGKKDTDLVPIHLATVRDIRGPLLGTKLPRDYSADVGRAVADNKKPQPKLGLVEVHKLRRPRKKKRPATPALVCICG